MDVLGPALVSSGLHTEGIQSQRMATTAKQLSWPFKAPFMVNQFEPKKFPHPKRKGEES